MSVIAKRASNPLADVAVLGSATVVATVLSAVANVVAARLLGPDDYGIWQTARLVIQYSAYASLGVGWAMHREIPYLAARSPDDTGLQLQIVRVTFGFTLISAAVVALATAIFGPRISDSIPAELYVVIAVTVVAQQTIIFADRLATTYGRYGLASVTNIVTSGLSLVLGIIGILVLGVRGLLLSQVCWSLIGTLIIVQAFHLKLVPSVSLGLLRRLIRVGLPTIGNGLLFLATKSIDRIMILAFLGTTSLGYYGLALSASNLIGMIFQPIGRVVLQRSSASYAQTDNVRDLQRPITRVLIGQMFIFSIIAGGVYLWLPFIVHVVLPDYRPAITATAVLLFGSALFALRSTLVYFFLAIDRLMSSYPLQIVLLGVGFIATWFSMRVTPSILTASIVTAAMFVTMGLAYVIHALHLTGATVPDIIHTSTLVVIPTIYAAAVGWVIITFIFHLSVDLSTLSLTTRSIGASVVFCLAQIPMAIFAERSAGTLTQIVGATRHILQGRRRAPDLAAGSRP